MCALEVLTEHKTWEATKQPSSRTFLQPCNNQIRVKGVFGQASRPQHHPAPTSIRGSMMLSGDCLGQTVFARSPDDHRLAPSMEDLEFLKIMEAECYQDSSKSWVAPLPFRLPIQRMPNNRKQVFDRFAPALIGKTTKDESWFPWVYGEDVREGARWSGPAGTAWTRVLVPTAVR